jgi:hypothetical protein
MRRWRGTGFSVWRWLSGIPRLEALKTIEQLSNGLDFAIGVRELAPLHGVVSDAQAIVAKGIPRPDADLTMLEDVSSSPPGTAAADYTPV